MECLAVQAGAEAIVKATDLIGRQDMLVGCMAIS